MCCRSRGGSIVVVAIATVYAIDVVIAIVAVVVIGINYLDESLIVTYVPM